MPTILITGATAGIGEATAMAFAAEGWNIILTGRRKERLQQLKELLEREYPIEVFTLCFDITKLQEVERSMASITKPWQAIDVLVNNAGLATSYELIEEGKPEDWDIMIDTNVKGLLYVTHMVLPWMISQHQGHIINLGSIAGKEVYPKGNVYCATKHAVDALTKAMRVDLLPHGIRVTGIHPGKVATEFSLVRYKGDTARADAEYKGYVPLQAFDVAEAILWAATRPAHVCINELTIMPTAQANTAHLLKNP
jgi:NADP-dependent 3-hydroxy acid dehydrogenase YdfG